MLPVHRSPVSLILCLIYAKYILSERTLVLEDRFVKTDDPYFKSSVFQECLFVNERDMDLPPPIPLPQRCRALAEWGTGPFKLFGRSGYTYNYLDRTCDYVPIGINGRCPSFPDRWSCEMTCLGQSKNSDGKLIKNYGPDPIPSTKKGRPISNKDRSLLGR